jgi:hypothetical protein
MADRFEWGTCSAKETTQAWLQVSSSKLSLYASGISHL